MKIEKTKIITDTIDNFFLEHWKLMEEGFDFLASYPHDILLRLVHPSARTYTIPHLKKRYVGEEKITLS